MHHDCGIHFIASRNLIDRLIYTINLNPGDYFWLKQTTRYLWLIGCCDARYNTRCYRRDRRRRRRC